MDGLYLHEYFCIGIDCGKPFHLHPSCYRGHKYCSDECRTEAWKRMHKNARKNYDDSRAAKDLNAKRQHKLRERRKQTKKDDATRKRMAQEVRSTDIAANGVTSITVEKAMGSVSAQFIVTSKPQSTVQPEAHVTYRASGLLKDVSEIVTARPGGLTAIDENLDATVVAGDRARPAIHAGDVDERGGEMRATGTLAVRTGTSSGSAALERGTVAMAWGPGPRCARCGGEGRVLRHSSSLAGGP
jgi:hypothetical protein